MIPMRNHVPDRKPRPACSAGFDTIAEVHKVMSDLNPNSPLPARRDFLKAGAVSSVLASGFPAIISAQSVTNAIKVGLVGCGGRGTGAASQALTCRRLSGTSRGRGHRPGAGRSVSRHSEGGFEDRRPRARRAPRQFLGLDAYQRVVASGVDVVLLATPPGFRPLHLAACIEANKHVFCEKPVATDAPGVRCVLETVEKAKQKNLSLVAGFCWRYNAMIQETFEQMHDGAIGKLVAYYATYYTSPVKPMPPASTRPAGMSDTEWQIRNWYNFVWLCGDSIVEQAVHSVDKIAWAMNDEPPVSCVGVGGRAIPAEGGNIYDHFEVNYLYPNGVRAFLANRQIEGCYNENSDYMLGTDGACTIGRGPDARASKARTNGPGPARSTTCTSASTTCCSRPSGSKQPVNDGKRMATSTLLAMMGRMAAYTGQQVTWEQALNSQEKLVPDVIDWKGALPVAPRAQPGITKFI